jgi:putative isomerase
VKEIFPKLLRYHRWWYTHRDHDRNGLCEYGSTDGTLQAAKWESGWDNAARFDSAKMLQNNSHAWSMDQESCDLNCYLFVEKYCLSRLATIIGDLRLSVDLFRQANLLADQISHKMWDENTGFFYDIRIGTGRPVVVAEPNGWIPLWAGIAGKEQAAQIVKKIMNPSEFNTFVPFPTVSAGSPAFNPEKGYWRGPVWLDQAWFALKGMRDYSYTREADSLMIKLMKNCEGMLDPSMPVRENYHPLNGKGLNASGFSWSAAHILMMISDAMKPQ